MTLLQLIACAKAYQDLSSPVQRQLDAVLDGVLTSHNAHALDLMARWLVTVERVRGMDSDLQEDLDLTREDLKRAFAQAEL